MLTDQRPLASRVLRPGPPIFRGPSVRAGGLFSIALAFLTGPELPGSPSVLKNVCLMGLPHAEISLHDR